MGQAASKVLSIAGDLKELEKVSTEQLAEAVLANGPDYSHFSDEILHWGINGQELVINARKNPDQWFDDFEKQCVCRVAHLPSNSCVVLRQQLKLLFYPEYHTFKASGQSFDVPIRYEFLKPIGHGAYGVVVSVLDKTSGKKVAIKKIQSAFDDAVDAKRILREILLMKKLVHDNVIRIIDLLPPHTHTLPPDDIYIVQDLMETDLHRIIYSRQALTIEHIQYFVYQILRGCKYLHSANVLHRDLKPSNLLLNSNCDLKICDFGLARERAGALTEYVVTRWYR